MVCTNLILDFTEEYIALHCNGINYISDISTDYFWTNTDDAIQRFATELAAKEFTCQDLIISLPINRINHQIVTLPDNVSDKEKLVFLGLEINRKLIGRRFGIKRLDVTKRQELDQELCDYLVLSPKPDAYTRIEKLALALNQVVVSIIPSFYLLGTERLNELRATAWVGEDRSEIVIWGKDNPLAITTIPNNGDQIGDINRFIVDYFDHVDNLTLSMIYLYGPRLKDSALGFGLTYPHMICEDPTRYLAKHLFRASEQINIAKVTKLPRAPIPMTPRNLTFIASALIAAIVIFLTGLTHADNLNQKHKLVALERKSSEYKKLNSHYIALKKESVELEAEKDFYLSITKRRTPWDLILKDISKLTPKELWFERINASKIKLLIMGKARSTEEVSDLSINLNNNSKYVQDALIVGTRDYEEDNGSKYSEFQIQAKFKSPTGKFTEKLE